MIPKPDMYADWKNWARKLVIELTQAPVNRQLPVYNKANLPPPSGNTGLIYVPDEVGGAVPAYSDGTDWRRISDGAVVS